MILSSLFLRRLAAPLLFLLFFAGSSFAYDDAQALSGLTTGRGVYLLDFESAGKTALYLQLIQATHQSMKAQNVSPDFVVVIIGPTVKFLRDEAAASPEEAKQREAIAAAVKGLADLGVRIEVCAIATDFFKVDNATLFPGLHLVGNGFNSLIGYQSKGYALVPVF